ncbi:hypothetical protein [Kaarinaea lacus]
MNLKDKVVKLYSSARSFQLRAFAWRYPLAYLGATAVFALIGYAYLLAFPATAVYALLRLFATAQQPLAQNNITTALIWFALLLIATAISHHIFTIKFPAIKELALQSDKLPHLFSLLSSKKRWFWPKINKVVLTDQYELEIRKTPLTGIPIWSSNTLVLGFPLMQSLSAEQFQCLLHRKLLQYSKGRNILSHWLQNLINIWPLFYQAFSSRNLLGDQTIAWFFRYYATLYQRFALYTAQMDELAADRLSLADINDRDLFKSIEAQIVTQQFVQHHYFPMLINMATTGEMSIQHLTPFAKLPVAMRKSLNDKRIKQWLEKRLGSCEADMQNNKTNELSLQQRMANIGHSRIRPPSMAAQSAAEIYFAVHYKNVVNLMDKSWQRKLLQYKKSSLQHNKRSSRTSYQLKPA